MDSIDLALKPTLVLDTAGCIWCRHHSKTGPLDFRSGIFEFYFYISTILMPSSWWTALKFIWSACEIMFILICVFQWILWQYNFSSPHQHSTQQKRRRSSSSFIFNKSCYRDFFFLQSCWILLLLFSSWNVNIKKKQPQSRLLK